MLLSFYLKCLAPSRHFVELETNCICQTKQTGWWFNCRLAGGPDNLLLSLNSPRATQRTHIFPFLLPHPLSVKTVSFSQGWRQGGGGGVLWHFPRLPIHRAPTNITTANIAIAWPVCQDSWPKMLPEGWGGGGVGGSILFYLPVSLLRLLDQCERLLKALPA